MPFTFPFCRKEGGAETIFNQFFITVDAGEASRAREGSHPAHRGDPAAGAQSQLQGEDVQGEDCWSRGSGIGMCC